MNTNLIGIIKDIVDKNGEDVLYEHRRMYSFLADFAKNEPKPLKNVFIKCLENGYVKILKNADKTELVHCKQRLAKKLSDEEGFDIILCNDALELLFNILNIQQPILPISNNETSENTEIIKVNDENISKYVNIIVEDPISESDNNSTVKKDKQKLHNKKHFLFALISMIGGGIAGVIVQKLRIAKFFYLFGEYFTHAYYLAWAGFTCFFISISIILVKVIYQKKKIIVNIIFKCVLSSVLISMTSILIFSNLSYYFFDYKFEIFRKIIEWGIIGISIGIGLSMININTLKKRTVIAGFIGGFLGASIITFLSLLLPIFPYNLINGFFIGLAISWVNDK